MNRKHFPNIFTFFMIFNLVFFQTYPLAFALADGTETTSATVGNSADTSSSFDSSSSASADSSSTKKSDSGSSSDTTGKSSDSKSSSTPSDSPDKSASDSGGASATSSTTPDKSATPPASTSADGSQSVSATATSTTSTTTPTPADGSQSVSAASTTTAASTVTADTPGTPSTEENPAASPDVSTDPTNTGSALPVAGDSAAQLSAPATAPTTDVTDPTITNTNTNDATVDNSAVTTSDTGGNTATANQSPDTTATDTTTVTNAPPDASATPPTPATDTTSLTDTTTSAPATDSTTTTTTPTPNATVTTGDASATTVIKNNVNTNVTTTNGSISNTDIYNYAGDVNLLTAFQTVLDNAKKVTDSNADAVNLAIQNINTALVANNATTTASTGDNGAGGGAADVTTGEATALTDIVNYINTNIVGNNWLYATLNIFGTWNGNLIVPGDGLLSVPVESTPTNVSVSNSNAATVTNTATTTADTGGNSATSGTGDVKIQTGAASSGTNVATVVNTNITQNNWFLLLLNNMGSWTGELLNWNGTDTNSALTYNLGTYGTYDAPTGSGGSLTVTNQNNATVNNTATTTADTGGNSAATTTGNANITTGNASALTNIFNLINTNIVGDNWFFGVVNNMGNWNGNVEFAYPDLAVALSDNSGAVAPGANVTYTLHYKNLGQADAGATHLTLKLPSDLSASQTSWDLSSLATGQEGTINVGATVNGNATPGETLTSTADIATTTKEVNLDNNSATDTLAVASDPTANSSDNSGNSIDSSDSNLKVKRSTTAGASVKPGDHVKNTIVVENDGQNTLYNVAVKENMLTTGGAKLADFSWPIGKMKKGGKVMIQYDFIVNNPGQSTTVNYVARAAGEDTTGHAVTSHKASELLTVLGFVATANAQTIGPPSVVPGAQAQTPAVGQVLGVANSQIPKLPLWIWLAALVAFLLGVNWSLFPQKIKLPRLTRTRL